MNRGDQRPGRLLMRATDATVEPTTVERYNRRTRWFYAATYLTCSRSARHGVVAADRPRRPASPLARLTGVPDPTLHTWVGWALAVLAAVAVTVGARAARTFLIESVRFRRADLRWFIRWPAAVVTGRFTRHDGHFDPANGSQTSQWSHCSLHSSAAASG